MKVIIAGSRRLTGVDARRLVMEAALASGWLSRIKEVVSGGARGIDAAAERWAKHMALPCAVFAADWGAHGRAAGPIRNRQMRDYADALIAVPHPTKECRGTRDMIAAMRAAGKPVYVHEGDVW
jgi:hypothetical protein